MFGSVCTNLPPDCRPSSTSVLESRGASWRHGGGGVLGLGEDRSTPSSSSYWLGEEGSTTNQGLTLTLGHCPTTITNIMVKNTLTLCQHFALVYPTLENNFPSLCPSVCMSRFLYYVHSSVHLFVTFSTNLPMCVCPFVRSSRF